jgi:hypothetical protein
MKMFYPLMLASITLIASCKKKSEDDPAIGITYPGTLNTGDNILAFPDSSMLTDGSDYEIGAQLEADATLKVILTNFPQTDTTTGHSTIWFYDSEQGWHVGDYNDAANTQEFQSTTAGKISADIQFFAYGQTGTCRIDFYENGSTLTKSKVIMWH